MKTIISLIVLFSSFFLSAGMKEDLELVKKLKDFNVFKERDIL